MARGSKVRVTWPGERGFVASVAQEREMLAVALAAISTGNPVHAKLSDDAEGSDVTWLSLYWQSI